MSMSIERVRTVASDRGLEIEVVSFDVAVRTAAEAAAALGCDISEIVKSLVFSVGTELVVALLPGHRRLDVLKLATVAANGGIASRASLDEVRAATGFVAGGTPPFGHVTDMRIFADNGLRRSGTVWAAAGTPHTVFEISVDDLDRISAPVWTDLAEHSAERDV